MKHPLPVIFALIAAPALAEETRQLDAHEHGVGELNIAIDGSTVVMELHAPGADIVGFEYEAESAEDRAATDAAIATLSRPLDLFVLPAAAECSVTEASVELETEHDDDHDEHGHDEHAEGEKHAEGEDHDEHDHDDEHAEGEAHDDHDHDEDHADEAGHTEFHAEYALTCGNPSALTDITFAYFETFENALEVEVQLVSSSGAQAFEVERDAPTLDLRGML